jgi:hypothetical protein
MFGIGKEVRATLTLEADTVVVGSKRDTLSDDTVIALPLL